MDVDLPTQAVRDRWEDLEADLDATAAELEAEGWTTVPLHVGDVTTRPRADPPAFEVLVPGNEFAALGTHLDAGVAFAETAVYRSAGGGVVFLLCVWRDPDARVAALFPAFYPHRGRDAMALADHARDAGAVHFRVRTLSRDRAVTFTIEDPALVFPDEWE